MTLVVADKCIATDAFRVYRAHFALSLFLLSLSYFYDTRKARRAV